MRKIDLRMKDTNAPADQSTWLKKLRVVLWPIENHELKKFFPMALMMFAILFNYWAARTVKDSLIVSHIGAEAISYIKLYMVLPSAILAMLFYSKLVNVMRPEKVFYTIITIFILFFGAFGLFLYPNAADFHPNPDTVAHLISMAPRFKWVLNIAGHWVYAAYYIMAELWGSMALSLLFWGFANQITASSQAKRFYAMLGFLSSVALICSGRTMRFLGGLGDAMALIQGVSLLLVISGIVVLIVYAWMQRYVVHDPKLCPQAPKKTKKKAKLSIKESLHLIFTTRYIGYIAVMVVAYGISINIIETVWKAKVRHVYPDVSAYAAFMGSYAEWTAYGIMFFTLLGANLLRLVRWRTAALLVPVIFTITGISFFSFVIVDESSRFMLPALGMSTALIAVKLGTLQNVLSKSSKYALFDATKEMAYIPIDNELKTKGKAAVDVVGARLGKSGGAFIISTLTFLFPTHQLTDFVPGLLVFYLIIIVVWCLAVRGLSREYEALIGNDKQAS